MKIHGILIAIAVIIFLFLGIWISGIGFINNSPGLYKYSVDIQGLENYEPSLITDIIVPLPQRDGVPVFSDDELQYKTFGSWRSMIVVTQYGKMLAFQSVGRNLTDLDAEFYKKYPEGIVIRNITQESLSPVLPLISSTYSLPVDSPYITQEYSTIVYIPESIRPLHTNDEILINLTLIASEGMQHSLNGMTYTVQVSEKIPSGTYNSTPVVVHILKTE
jgi:hypothetical protein